jgi:DUF971 family protein
MEVPERIEVDRGTSLRLTWPDGVVTTTPAAALRAACECATCLAPGANASGIGDAGAVRILDASIVGAYALNLTFAPDQHSTGIFPFDRLRALGEATPQMEE